MGKNGHSQHRARHASAPAPRWRRKSVRWLLLAAMAACLGIVGGMWFWPPCQQVAEQRAGEPPTASDQDATPANVSPPSLADPSPSSESAPSPPDTKDAPREPIAVPPRAPPAPLQVPSTLPETIEALKTEEIETAQWLLREFPRQGGPMGLMGMVYNHHGNTQEAVRCWQAWVELDPEAIEAYYQMGWVATRRGEHEEAVTQWRNVLRLDPTRPGIHQQIAGALTCLGRQHEAIEALKQDIEVNPKAFHSHFLLGQAHLQLEQYEQAKRCYETAIQLKPDFPNAYFSLATVCRRLGQKDEAKRYAEDFKKLHTRELGVLKERNQTFDDLQSARGKAAKFYTEAGSYCREHGRAATAAKLWRRAAVLDPKNAECRRQLASWYEMNRFDREATQVYEELRALEPGDAMTHALLGVLYARSKRLDAAEEAMRKVVELAPERPEGYAALAQLYLHTNQNLAETRTLAQQAVKLQPIAWHYVLLSDACRRNGDPAGAVSAMERAVELEGGNKELKTRLRGLREEK